ncbi:hypothetical protein QAD02_006434 [Eretmocerus hayati]|uniref:Uncharacterized protein n=1 Tax=Eretmocerus hayati TaxID=131215 RepID=A0ACC2N0Z2_9HYME|nr:hypothetical protein QAD02_006434 [Eretmocerus hayati]
MRPTIPNKVVTQTPILTTTIDPRGRSTPSREIPTTQDPQRISGTNVEQSTIQGRNPSSWQPQSTVTPTQEKTTTKEDVTPAQSLSQSTSGIPMTELPPVIINEATETSQTTATYSTQPGVRVDNETSSNNEASSVNEINGKELNFEGSQTTSNPRSSSDDTKIPDSTVKSSEVINTNSLPISFPETSTDVPNPVDEDFIITAHPESKSADSQESTTGSTNFENNTGLSQSVTLTPTDESDVKVEGTTETSQPVRAKTDPPILETTTRDIKTESSVTKENEPETNFEESVITTSPSPSIIESSTTTVTTKDSEDANEAITIVTTPSSSSSESSPNISNIPIKDTTAAVQPKSTSTDLSQSELTTISTEVINNNQLTQSSTDIPMVEDSSKVREIIVDTNPAISITTNPLKPENTTKESSNQSSVTAIDLIEPREEMASTHETDSLDFDSSTVVAPTKTDVAIDSSSQQQLSSESSTNTPNHARDEFTTTKSQESSSTNFLESQTSSVPSTDTPINDIVSEVGETAEVIRSRLGTTNSSKPDMAISGSSNETSPTTMDTTTEGRISQVTITPGSLPPDTDSSVTELPVNTEEVISSTQQPQPSSESSTNNLDHGEDNSLTTMLQDSTTPKFLKSEARSFPQSAFIPTELSLSSTNVPINETLLEAEGAANTRESIVTTTESSKPDPTTSRPNNEISSTTLNTVTEVPNAETTITPGASPLDTVHLMTAASVKTNEAVDSTLPPNLSFESSKNTNNLISQESGKSTQPELSSPSFLSTKATDYINGTNLSEVSEITSSHTTTAEVDGDAHRDQTEPSSVDEKTTESTNGDSIIFTTLPSSPLSSEAPVTITSHVAVGHSSSGTIKVPNEPVTDGQTQSSLFTSSSLPVSTTESSIYAFDQGTENISQLTSQEIDISRSPSTKEDERVGDTSTVQSPHGASTRLTMAELVPESDIDQTTLTPVVSSTRQDFITVTPSLPVPHTYARDDQFMSTSNRIQSQTSINSNPTPENVAQNRSFPSASEIKPMGTEAIQIPQRSSSSGNLTPEGLSSYLTTTVPDQSGIEGKSVNEIQPASMKSIFRIKDLSKNGRSINNSKKRESMQSKKLKREEIERKLQEILEMNDSDHKNDLLEPGVLLHNSITA